jgi:hypothetical protein
MARDRGWCEVLRRATVCVACDGVCGVRRCAWRATVCVACDGVRGVRRCAWRAAVCVACGGVRGVWRCVWRATVCVACDGVRGVRRCVWRATECVACGGGGVAGHGTRLLTPRASPTLPPPEMLFFGYFFDGKLVPGTRMDDGWTEHTGCPTREGKKWIATMWYRQGVTKEKDWACRSPGSQTAMAPGKEGWEHQSASDWADDAAEPLLHPCRDTTAADAPSVASRASADWSRFGREGV